jgi:hypothetical protein
VPSLSDGAPVSLDARTTSDGGVEAAVTFGRPGEDGADAVVVATSPSGGVVETAVAGARSATFAP